MKAGARLVMSKVRSLKTDHRKRWQCTPLRLGHKKAGLKSARLENDPREEGLLNLFVHRVALEMLVILLFLNPFGDGLFVTRGEVAGNRFSLFAGLSAL